MCVFFGYSAVCSAHVHNQKKKLKRYSQWPSGYFALVAGMDIKKMFGNCISGAFWGGIGIHWSP